MCMYLKEFQKDSDISPMHWFTALATVTEAETG